MRAVRPPPCLLRIGSSLQSGTAPAGELRCKCKVNERFSPLLEYVLDDDVDRYLPFRVRNPAWPDVAITWRMLLTHTSSLNEEDDERVGRTDVLGKDPRDTLADVMTQHFCARSASWWPQQFRRRKPGTERIYSDDGYSLAGFRAATRRRGAARSIRSFNGVTVRRRLR